MSISTLESADSRRMLADMQAHADEAAAEEQAMRECFLEAAKAGDMEAFAFFAPRTTDWPRYHAGDKSAKRVQTVGEIIFDGISAVGDPCALSNRAMAVLCAASRGEVLQEDAQAVLAEAAKVWARQNV